MPRKHEITIYTFDELSAKAQERAISDFRNSGGYWTDFDHEDLVEDFKQQLKELELPTEEAFASIGFVQGDGVGFQGTLDWRNYIEKNKLKEFKSLLESDEVDLQVKILMGRNSPFMHVEWDYYGPAGEPLPEKPRKPRKRWGWKEPPEKVAEGFVSHLKDHINQVAADLYNQGRDEILYAMSDEAIRERLEELDREYTEDGRRYCDAGGKLRGELEGAQDRYEVYYVADPVEALGMPRDHKWAVALNGSFLEAFRTKREANAYVKKAQLERNH